MSRIIRLAARRAIWLWALSALLLMAWPAAASHLTATVTRAAAPHRMQRTYHAGWLKHGFALASGPQHLAPARAVPHGLPTLADSWSTAQTEPMPMALNEMVDGGNGKYYVTAGVGPDGHGGNVINPQFYSVDSSGAFNQLANVPKNGVALGLLVSDMVGHVFLLGGQVSTTVLSTMYEYDIASNAWSQLGNLPSPMSAGVAVYDGQGHIYATPGVIQNTQSTTALSNQLFEYTIAAKSWQAMASAPQDMALNAGVYDGAGHLIMNGGANSATGGTFSADNTILRYNISGNSWDHLAYAPGGMVLNVMGLDGQGRLLATEGIDTTGAPATGLYLYDIQTDTWNTMTSAPAGMAYNAAALIGGNWWVTGGVSAISSQTLTFSTSVYAFKPLPLPFVHITEASALPAGTIHVSGQGFLPLEVVTVHWDTANGQHVAGTVTTGVDGTITNAALKLTKNRKVASFGAHRMVAVGGTSGWMAEAALAIGAKTNAYWFTWYDLASSSVITSSIVVVNPNTTATQVTINLGGGQVASTTLAAGAAGTFAFPGKRGGPVEIISSQPVLASEQSRSGNSYNQIAATPNTMLSAQVYFPYYDFYSGGINNDWILIGNPNPMTATETVAIYAGGKIITSSAISLAGMSTGYVQFPGFRGSVVIRGKRSVIATQINIVNNAVSFVPGTPAPLVKNDAWFSYYDSYSGSITGAWIIIANTGISTATVQVTAGAMATTVAVAGHDVAVVSFPGGRGGPVHITSNGAIVASMRTLAANGFHETLGTPSFMLTPEPAIAAYGAAGSTVQGAYLMLANITASYVQVQVMYGGAVQQTMVLKPGQEVTPDLPTVTGPVMVMSALPIYASERLTVNNSFSEVLSQGLW